MKRVAVGLVLASALHLAACATTKPWQREYLADPIMAPDDPEPARISLLRHVRQTREGAVGGFGGGGGGCGCN